MIYVEIIFWVCLVLVFYTFVGYGVVLYVLVRIKEAFVKRSELVLPEDLPEVTLLIAAYNEESVVHDKMANCRTIDYPSEKFRVVWVTDGSNDRTNELLAEYTDATVLFDPARRGKSAAIHRAMKFIDTPITVFTDANTILNSEAIKEIVRCFTDPNVGCVSGEKRVAQDQAQNATAGEGMYWKYESLLKSLDDRLCSAMGAAGELFAIRTELYEEIPRDALLDDFMMSFRIVQRGYKIAYTKDAYAQEDASADIKEESKRKVRIAAGGLQTIWRMRELMNPLRYGIISFQYVSHRVLRWTVTPRALFLLYPLNVVLTLGDVGCFYTVLLVLQTLFYLLVLVGWMLSAMEIKSKILFVPFYFVFMNVNAIRGTLYLIRRRKNGNGAWEKAKRRTK